jgi:hypothetical protein
MKQPFAILAACLFALGARAGQQALTWTISPSNSVNQYVFDFIGPTNFQVTVTNRLTSSNTFSIPAGRWLVRAFAVTTNWGISDPSNPLEIEIPQPITIRINLSSADTPGGPWKEETNSPPIVVVATEPARFYRAAVVIDQ